MLGGRTTRWIGVAVGSALVVAACGDDGGGGAALDPDADLSQQTLTISNWDLYTPENLIPSFTEEYGTEVELALHATNEEIVGKLLQSDGEGYDVAFVSGQFAQQLDEAGLLAELDPDLIPNLSNLYPEALEMEHDPGLTFSVPYTWGTTGICYRSDLVPTAPTSWDDILAPAPENVGKITMLATDRWLMLPAQKSLGFSVNTTDEDELAQVTELLAAAKANLLAYDDTTFFSRLVSGEANLVVAWDGWCNYGIAEDPNIQFVVPEEGSDLWTDTMVVLESSENKEAAHAFINWVLAPENQQAVAELVYYKVPNAAAMDGLDPALVEQFPNLGMTPADLLGEEQLLDLGEDTATYTEIVAQVTAG
jgi:spermidine/putrescine transport system substrate-binding protein